MLINADVGINLNNIPLSKEIKTFWKMLKYGTQSSVNKRNKRFRKTELNIILRDTIKLVLLWTKRKIVGIIANIVHSPNMFVGKLGEVDAGWE
jgi:hypothetical protein